MLRFRKLNFALVLLLAPLVRADQPAMQGLDSLPESAVLDELSARGLDPLLERAFDVDHVPEPDRLARRTLLALSRLADSSSNSNAQRQQLISQILSGIDQAAASIDDPNLLTRQAFVLITQAADRDVNTLEFWGENPRTQSQLRPVVLAIDKLLTRAQELATQQADQLASQITGTNSPLIAKYETLEKTATTAEYTRNMVAYYLAISIDPASAQRKQVASDAADYLKQFDVVENPDRNVVRNRMAKLAMARSDFDTAIKIFSATLAADAQPKPNVAQQYEARYFSALCQLLNRDPNMAQRSLEKLVDWQQDNLPQDKTARDGAEAAATMLQYRITSIRADLASDPRNKAIFNSQAVQTLLELLQKRPDLQAIIYDQLLPKLTDTASLQVVDPLFLRALVSKGEQELQSPGGTAEDAKIFNRAIDAAKEIAQRKNQVGIDAQTVNASALLIPFFLQRLGQLPQAAEAFIEYADQHKTTDAKNAELALNNAEALIGQLRNDSQTRDDAAVVAAYEKFLPLAIAPPFNRRQFAFEYARRLQLNGDVAAAIEEYSLVPRDDARSLDAMFYQLLAIKQQLDASAAQNRDARLNQAQELADQIKTAVDASPSPHAKSILARTTLIAAELARREQHDPRRALALLNNFDASIAGLGDADALGSEAMYVRVQSLMADAQYAEATDELVKLLDRSGGSRGAQIVYNLLEKLNADFQRAEIANDREAMQRLSQSRARLSGFLVQWAAGNSDADIKKFTYRYRVFDAETQRRAAQLETDPAAGLSQMQDALKRYEALESPENLALYKSSLDATQRNDADLYDPQVTFGIALIHYDLADYAPAASGLSKLLTQRKLGTALNTISENGETRSVDNDQYWEAIYKLIRSDQQLHQNLDQAAEYLKTQYITWGSHVGGTAWKREFESLRADLIPDFKTPAISSTTHAE